ncbi:hypothetical protein BGZ94_008097 [Podila epigama]|nr:hypothetical protein BGZ94_008097 [Podila epigama]
MAAQQLKALANGTNVLLVTKMITIGSMGIFAGNALTYATTIMPTLRKFASSSSLAVWCEMYLLAKLGGAGLYYKTHNRYYLCGSVMMAAIAPYTWSLLYPINNRLLEIRKSGRDNPKVEEMLVRWDAIAFGRVLISYTAMFVTLFGAIRPHSKS